VLRLNLAASSEPRCEHDPAPRGCCRWRSLPAGCWNRRVAGECAACAGASHPKSRIPVPASRVFATATARCD